MNTPGSDWRKALFELSLGNDVSEHYAALVHLPTAPDALATALRDARICSQLSLRRTLVNAPAGCRFPTALTELLERAMARHEIWMRAVRDVVQEADRREIRYLLLKGAFDQVTNDYTLPRSSVDIDVVAEGQQAYLLASVLRSIGFVERGQRKQELRFSRGPVHVELSIDWYGSFPDYRPHPLVRAGVTMTRELRLRLLTEEWLANGFVRVADILDLRRLLALNFCNDSDALLNAIPESSLRAIGGELIRRYCLATAPPSKQGIHWLSKHVARNFLKNRGRRPLLFGAHWVRVAALWSRHQNSGFVHASLEVLEFLVRTYATKFRRWRKSRPGDEKTANR